jgi:hypothetical protein
LLFVPYIALIAPVFGSLAVGELLKLGGPAMLEGNG